MDNYQDLLGLSSAKFAEAKALLEKATPEDKERIESILTEARDLKSRAMQLKDITDNMADVINRQEAAKPDENKSERKSKTAWKDWGEFLHAAWMAPQLKKADIDPRLEAFKEVDDESGHSTKQMAENVGAQGGFLVPAEFMADLQAVIGENSLVRPRATIIRMRRRQIDIPVLDQTGTTANIPHWFGGMRFYWTEEAAEKTHTEATFRQVALVAHKLVGYTYASDELVSDSAISLADFLGGPLGMAGGIAWNEDYCFFLGTGAGQPLGVINAGCTISVAAQANPPAPGSIYIDLVNMMENFLPTGRGEWFINQRHMSDLLTMNGPAANPSYIWGSAITGAPNTLLGLPVHFTEKLPGPATAGSILLADFRYYLIGDRQATTVESTQYDRWKYDQTSWRAVHRVDGQPWLSTWLTLADGTSTVSPFVILGAKST